MKLEIPDEALSSLQKLSIERLIERAKHAHTTDIKMRINGQDLVIEADWIKNLRFGN